MPDDPFDLEQMTPTMAPDTPGEPMYFDLLNLEQRSAVEVVGGPLLVLAGAGTGKTRVLTTRLAHILHQRLAFPSQLLVVTFTNKAAREMAQRTAELVGRAVEGLWLGTFHSIGVRLLRRHGELVGLKSNFTILDTDDQLRLLKQLIEVEQLDPKRWPTRQLAAAIDRWKDRGLAPEKVPPGEGERFANGRGVILYKAYQERLKVLNACDFGDLLLHCLTIFANHGDILASYQKQFRYILVDEYQDTNVSQYLLLRLLAQGHKNICCVGDDDQSIYSWRGAEVGNILRFEKDFPGATVVRLERNYRSTPHILGAASGLINKNEGRLGKTLWTEVNDGEKVQVRGHWDGAEEARAVGEQVEDLQRQEQQLNEMAVLVRASFQTREFEERFLTLGVPYRLIGGKRFYERAEIRDATAYLRVIAQSDDDLAFERIVNTPRRGLGNATIQLLHQAARGMGTSLTRTAQSLITGDDLTARARNSLRKLLESVDRWRGLVDDMPPDELTGIVLDESGYTGMWQASKDANAPSKLENLKELIVALEPFDKLGGFLEHVSLVTDMEMAQAAAERVLAEQVVMPFFAIQANAALALLAVQKGDGSAAAEHHEYLLGQRGTMIWTLSSVDRLLGPLSQTMGNLDQAVVHFEDALVFCRRAGYRPELAWAYCDSTDVIQERNGPGDRAKTVDLLNESLAISTELGMLPLMERVTER